MRPIPDMWRYAEAAYKEPKGLDFVDHKDFAYLETDDDFAFASIEDRRVVFSFRGTDGDFMAWVTNFFAMPSGDGLIHKGFYNAWRPFKDMVNEVLHKYPPAMHDYWVTGHSRGGATGTLCARHIAKNLRIPCRCITFGCPAQGQKEYREQMDMLPVNLTNVINGYDLVTMLPPRLLGFRSAGKNFRLKAPWYQFLFRKIWFHLQKNYRKRIAKRFGKDCYVR